MKRKLMIRYLFLALIAVIVGVNMQAVIASTLTGNKVPMPLGVGLSVVMSGSMEPEFKVGDLIIIKEYKEGAQPQISDVIVYQTGSMAVVHRVIDINEDMLTTQGDANNVADEPFDISAVKGKVIFSLRYIGYLVLLLKTPLGILATFGLAILFLELSFREDKREKKQKEEELKAEIRRLLEEQKENTNQ